MMINKRLIGTVPESKRYVAGNVILQWCSLLANIAMMTAITRLLAALYLNAADGAMPTETGLTALCAVVIRFFCTTGSARMGYLSSRAVKRTLRAAIYEKLLRLGASYNEQVKTSEIVQVAVEGVDQLEMYFGAYLPQFFYAMLAPVTLFAELCRVNLPASLVLLVCVPLIPVAIAAVQTWAKKLLSKYWGQYTALGDTFLENLQGLTTLKIYQADEAKNEEMNVQAEKFRRITMKVLTMQLNSITIMDLIAYGGAALGVIMAATQYRAGHVTLGGALLIILLAADFFIPMRQLGSFFHIAMNGMAASDKIFRLLDLPEPETGGAECPEGEIACRELRFSYEPEREILHGLDSDVPRRVVHGHRGRVRLRQEHDLLHPHGTQPRLRRLGHHRRRGAVHDPRGEPHAPYHLRQPPELSLQGNGAREPADGLSRGGRRGALARARAGEARGLPSRRAGAGHPPRRKGRQPLGRPVPAARAGAGAAA